MSLSPFFPFPVSFLSSCVFSLIHSMYLGLRAYVVPVSYHISITSVRWHGLACLIALRCKISCVVSLVRSSHYTVLSTRRHRAHPVSVPILPPREILVQALWSQNHHETMQWHVIVLVRCWLLALLFFVLLRYDTRHTGMNIISLHSRIYTKDLLCCSRCMCSSHLSTGRHPAHPVSALILHLTAHVEKFCGLYTTTPSFCKGSRQRNAMPSCGCCWPFRF